LGIRDWEKEYSFEKSGMDAGLFFAVMEDGKNNFRKPPERPAY
jgi:hypothetical protein